MKLKVLFIAVISGVIWLNSGCDKKMNDIPENRVTVIEATISQPDTKTTLSGSDGETTRNVLWNNGDKIMVVTDAANTAATTGVVFTTSISTPASSASFSGTGTLTNTVAAYYPAEQVISYSKDYYTFTFKLPTVQKYKAGSFDNGYNPAIAYTATWGESSILTFKNILGVIKTIIKAPAENDITVTKLHIYSKSQSLSGVGIIQDLNYGPDYYINMNSLTAGGDNSVTLDCTDEPGGGVTIAQGGTHSFYIVIPPKSYYTANDLTIVVETKESGFMIRNSSNDLTVFASKIKPMNLTFATTNANYSTYGSGTFFNFGASGVKIVAPVNCGYDATNFPYGLLYQFGRKDGQGYGTSGFQQSSFTEGGTSFNTSTSVEIGTPASNTWYYYWKYDGNWVISSSCCPSGWEVMGYNEINYLKNIKLANKGWKNSGQTDYKHGTTSGLPGCYYTSGGTLFFPAAGYRKDTDHTPYDRGTACYYWSWGSSKYYWSYDSSNNNSINTGVAPSAYSVRCVKY